MFDVINIHLYGNKGIYNERKTAKDHEHQLKSQNVLSYSLNSRKSKDRQKLTTELHSQILKNNINHNK